MPKAIAVSSSHGLSETASPESQRGPDAASGKQVVLPQSTKKGESRAKLLCDNARKNGRGSFSSLDTWQPHLDSYLIEMLARSRGTEREAIAFIRRSHRQFSERLIWSRIVYLGLTDRKRPPYRKHEWTAEEDQILRNEYGRSRTSSHDAIEKILTMHPDWSRDTVICRARALGLTQPRELPYRAWTPALDHLLLSLRGCQPDTIAKRLRCTKESALGRLRRLGWGAEFFGGFKTKDLVRELRVPETAVERWVRLGWLARKKGRITEASLRWLCRHHSEEIPFETLAPEARNWLTLSLGYGREALARSRDQKQA
jgi:hypothetical protein